MHARPPWSQPLPTVYHGHRHDCRNQHHRHTFLLVRNLKTKLPGTTLPPHPLSPCMRPICAYKHPQTKNMTRKQNLRTSHSQTHDSGLCQRPYKTCTDVKRKRSSTARGTQDRDEPPAKAIHSLSLSLSRT
ncbi:hypothetical protein BS50DRAFT_237669 [Corynespora cassiicola Philippines]|uniref:Uncharacterized protein n=1 Tax=Corynespora cassiicola Philippines TaxID=1448308 RepID=A0A2T2P2Y1_CORCC|nr:hypothetical protein BS50DRAFT_237669 [Corynespora cassiicola Philippines]